MDQSFAFPTKFSPERKKKKVKFTKSGEKGELMPLPWAAHFKSKVKIHGLEGGRGVSAVSSCKGYYSACLRLLACARSYGIIPKIPNLPPTSQTQVPAWHFMFKQQFRH